MPNRTLREGIRSSPIINALSDRGARLYVHLLVTADDFGLMEWTSSWVKAHAVPLLLWTFEDTSAAMQDISDKKAVRLYESGGKPYAAMEKWEQRQNAKWPKFPAPPWGFKGDGSHILGGYVPPRARINGAAPDKRKAPGRVNGSPRRGFDTWSLTDDGIRDKAKELEIPMVRGESFDQLKTRINAELARRNAA